MIVGLIAVVVVVAVAILLAAWNSDQKRHASLQYWARQREWSYSNRDDTAFEGFGGDPFGTGKSRKAIDVMTGVIGERSAVMFSYQYTESTFEGSATSHFSVCALSMPCAVGHLAIKPQGLFAKLGTKPGFADVQLENKAFNNAFRLSASSQKLAYDLVPRRNIDLLLDLPDADLRTEHDLLLAVGRGPLTMRHVDATLALLAAFLDNVPDFVWDDHRIDPTPVDPPAT